jgi:hypothetical protein
MWSDSSGFENRLTPRYRFNPSNPPLGVGSQMTAHKTSREQYDGLK